MTSKNSRGGEKLGLTTFMSSFNTDVWWARLFLEGWGSGKRGRNAVAFNMGGGVAIGEKCGYSLAIQWWRGGRGLGGLQ